MSLTSYFMLEDFVSMPQCQQMAPVPATHHQMTTAHQPIHVMGQTNYPGRHPHLTSYPNTYGYPHHLVTTESTTPTSYGVAPQTPSFGTAVQDTGKTDMFDFSSCSRPQVVQCPATSTTAPGPDRRKGGKPKADGVVAKRNARERRRVQAVNGAFSKLRKHIPYENRNKRLSKVKTLKIAIEYIHCLQDLLHRVDLGELRSSKAEQSAVWCILRTEGNWEKNFLLWALKLTRDTDKTRAPHLTSHRWSCDREGVHESLQNFRFWLHPPPHPPHLRLSFFHCIYRFSIVVEFLSQQWLAAEKDFCERHAAAIEEWEEGDNRTFSWKAFSYWKRSRIVADEPGNFGEEQGGGGRNKILIWK